MESITYNITYESLLEAYYNTNISTDSATEFGINVEVELYKLKDEIQKGVYTPSPSIAFIITDPKQREVFAAAFRDRVVHHWICLRIEPLLESVFINTSFNCRKDKGTLAAVKYAQEMVRAHSDNYTKDCYVVKLDLKGFFMSINRKLLWNYIESFIKNKYKADDLNILLYLLKVTILNAPEKNCIIRGSITDWIGLDDSKSLFKNSEDEGLPIGNLPSQMLGNFLLNLIDHIIVEILLIDLCRYVDDYLMIDEDKQKLLNAIPIIEERLSTLAGVKVNKNKFYCQNCKKGFKFLGAVIKWNTIIPTKRVIGNLYKKIHKFNSLVEKNPKIIYVLQEKFVQILNSYYGLIVHYSSYKIRKEIVNLIDKRWSKVIYITSDYKTFKVRKSIKKRERIKRKLLNIRKYENKRNAKITSSGYESKNSKRCRVKKDEKV